MQEFDQAMQHLEQKYEVCSFFTFLIWFCKVSTNIIFVVHSTCNVILKKNHSSVLLSF